MKLMRTKTVAGISDMKRTRSGVNDRRLFHQATIHNTIHQPQKEVHYCPQRANYPRQQWSCAVFTDTLL